MMNIVIPSILLILSSTLVAAKLRGESSSSTIYNGSSISSNKRSISSDEPHQRELLRSYQMDRHSLHGRMNGGRTAQPGGGGNGGDRAQSLSGFASEWLDAHNSRRKRKHEESGHSFVPLKWSKGLASQSQAYADLLRTTSRFQNECGIQHQLDDNKYGENLASNWAGEYNPPGANNVLTRWFDNQEHRSDTNRKLHFSQVAWRATHYVGCGEAYKTYTKNGRLLHCHIQVCRYARPGNCDFNRGSFLDVVMKQESLCGPFCPPEGCF